MAWSIRDESVEENQNGSSLTHYGVLGMKWGVRKEYEKANSRLKSVELLKGIFNKKSSSSSSETDREREEKAYRISVRYKSMKSEGLANKTRFNGFITDLKAGKSSIDSNITKAYDIDSAASKLENFYYRWNRLSDDEKIEAEQLANEVESLIGYYYSIYMSLETDDEKEWVKKTQEMMAKLRDPETTSSLHNDAKIEISRPDYVKDVDGQAERQFYIYTDPNGKKTKYAADQYDLMIANAKADKDKYKGFLNSKSSRKTREKNIDPNAKPATVKKGAKIAVSDKERFEKQVGSRAFQREVANLQKIADVNAERKKKTKATQLELQKKRINDRKSEGQKVRSAIESLSKKTSSAVGNLVSSGKATLSKIFNIKTTK